MRGQNLGAWNWPGFFQFLIDPVAAGQRDAQNDTGPLSYLADGASNVGTEVATGVSNAVTGAEDFVSSKFTSAENYFLFAVGFGILGFTLYQEIKKHS